MPVTLSERDFERFRDYFYRKTGIHFDTNKRYFVDKRIHERMHAKSIDSFNLYFNSLRFDSEGELQAMINLMTVNETYFLRESYQLDCLVNSMIDAVIAYKKPGERIRIWSLPCSTGEEAYSIALTLLERWPGLEQWDVEILASDIDTDAIKRAEQGCYSARSLQYLPLEWKRKYFDRRLNGRSDQHQLIDDIRDSVGFSRVNIHSGSEVSAMGKMDIIFCRNLLIYFDDNSRRQAAERLYDALNSGGILCLGHSESMSRIANLFSVERFADALVYRKQP